MGQHGTGAANETWKRRAIWGGYCFLAVAAFFLWTEHRAHVLGALPYVIALACPIIHLFMHRGHHRGAHQDHVRGGGES